MCEEISTSICNSYSIKSSLANNQIKRLLRKHFIESEKLWGRKNIYINEIKRLIRYEIERGQIPYFCSKCNKPHNRGNIHKNHTDFIRFNPILSM